MNCLIRFLEVTVVNVPLLPFLPPPMTGANTFLDDAVDLLLLEMKRFVVVDVKQLTIRVVVAEERRNADIMMPPLRQRDLVDIWGGRWRRGKNEEYLNYGYRNVR
jgi:hypothetical protein